MKQSFVFVGSGPYGCGKTIWGVSYTPKSWPVDQPVKRLVVDKEFRAVNYQSEAHSKTVDDPQNLLWSFKTFPETDGQDMTLEQWKLLVDTIKAPDRPNVLIFDNMAALQNDIEVWCQDSAGTRKYLDAVGKAKDHEFFLSKRFKQDQYWRKVQQAGIRELLLICKRNGVDVVITSELQNKWENYGVSGYGADGKPMQKIIGQQAKIWDEALKLADVNWRLTRIGTVVTAAPEISIDPLRPKMSLVGIPPKFKFTNWADIWAMESKRNVSDDKALSEIKVPEPTYGTTDVTEEAGETEPTAKDKLLKWATEQGYDLKEMSNILMPLKLWPYQEANDKAIRAALTKEGR